MQDNNQLRADIARMTSTPESSEVPASQSMTLRTAFADLIQGAKQRELWFMLGIQDIKQRYRRSVLGPFWITIATGVMAAALGLLYSMLFQIPVAEFLPTSPWVLLCGTSSRVPSRRAQPSSLIMRD